MMIDSINSMITDNSIINIPGDRVTDVKHMVAVTSLWDFANNDKWACHGILKFANGSIKVGTVEFHRNAAGRKIVTWHKDDVESLP